MRCRFAKLVAVLALAWNPVVASAADAALPAPTDRGWIVTLGAEGRIQPRFVGADESIVFPYPLFNFRRAGTPLPFRSPRDGFGIALIDSGTFAAGPVGQLVLQRKETDSSALRGLGDVDTTLELGAFADFWPASWLRAHIELRNGIGGHHGLVSDLALDAVVPVSSQWTLSAGPRMRLASAAAVSPYFSITSAQSIASGLPVFNAGGGVQSVGAGTQARYRWNEQWATHVFVEYDRLVGDTADSPLVAIRGAADQFTFGAGFTYAFNFAGW